LESLLKDKDDAYMTLEAAQSTALQEAQDELVIAKQLADDRIVELNNQMASDKTQSDELAEESKVISDGYVSELKSRLAEEEAASLLLKEQSLNLQETLDKMGSNQTESFDRIVALESQATKYKAEADELAEAKVLLDSRVAELESELIADRAASAISEGESAELQQQSLDALMADKMALDGQIIELVKQAEADKANADDLMENNATSNDRLVELESLLKDKDDAYMTLEAAQSTALQEAQDELVIAKQLADDERTVLENNLIILKAESSNLIIEKEKELLELQEKVMKRVDSLKSKHAESSEMSRKVYIRL
jgi:hypothetical protein